LTCNESADDLRKQSASIRACPPTSASLVTQLVTQAYWQESVQVVTVCAPPLARRSVEIGKPVP
jgi:hypothetical protein